jgi:hypothetical protein
MLLAIALSALGLRACDVKSAWVGLSRMTPRGELVDGDGYVAGCEHGRIAIGWWWDHYTDGWLRGGLADAAAHGAGWRWKGTSARPTWLGRAPAYSWGPFQWEIHGWRRTGISSGRRQIWASYWSVALGCGAWPTLSLLLSGRRWLVRRRRWWEGRCRDCAYDLRATPEGGLDLLSRCPECGKVRG